MAQYQHIAASPLFTASTPGAVELLCRTCGYGAVVAAAPRSCPICNGTSWEFGPRPSSSSNAAPRRGRPELDRSLEVLGVEAVGDHLSLLTTRRALRADAP